LWDFISQHEISYVHVWSTR